MQEWVQVRQHVVSRKHEEVSPGRPTLTPFYESNRNARMRRHRSRTKSRQPSAKSEKRKKGRRRRPSKKRMIVRLRRRSLLKLLR